MDIKTHFSLNSHVYTYHKSRLQQTCIPVSTSAFSGTDNEQDDPMERTDINSSGVTETAGDSNESDLLMDTTDFDCIDSQDVLLQNKKHSAHFILKGGVSPKLHWTM